MYKINGLQKRTGNKAAVVSTEILDKISLR